MIIVKLWGGMCNQMFQYAFGYAIAKKYNDDLAFDVDFYENQPGHVGKRKVIGKEVFPNLSKMQFIKRPSWVKPFENKYISHIIRYNWGCNLFIQKKHFLMEKIHHFYPQISHKEDVDNYYDGYWQTGLYFEDVAENLKYEFTPSEEVLKKVKTWRDSIDSSNCVAVHIRRGDYLSKVNSRSLKTGNVIGDETYYLKAIALMKSKIENPIFCFFSDDIEWCKKTFGERVENSLFVENQGHDAAIVDLFSIASCEHGIMSPSSFSWWGNWLRSNKQGSIVIAPDGNYCAKEYFDNNWIKL